MSPQTLFLVCNYGVLPAWLLLVLAPRSPWTERVVHSVAIPLLLAGVYLWALSTSAAPEGASFATLDGVMLLFTSS